MKATSIHTPPPLNCDSCGRPRRAGDFPLLAEARAAGMAEEELLLLQEEWGLVPSGRDENENENEDEDEDEDEDGTTTGGGANYGRNGSGAGRLLYNYEEDDRGGGGDDDDDDDDDDSDAEWDAMLDDPELTFLQPAARKLPALSDAEAVPFLSAAPLAVAHACDPSLRLSARVELHLEALAGRFPGTAFVRVAVPTAATTAGTTGSPLQRLLGLKRPNVGPQGRGGRRRRRGPERLRS